MIGIIPAAGKASRMNGLPKYLLPVPGGGHLLGRMCERVGVPCYIGANNENYDLIDAYKRPEDTVYLVNSKSMPQTVLAARKYAGNGTVLCGMPDTYWTDIGVFDALASRLDVGYLCAVALFDVDSEQRKRLGMCDTRYDLNDGITLTRIDDKNPHTTLRSAWGALAWTADFWQYIEESDAHMGIALQRAIDAGEKIRGCLADGPYYDNATPDDYFRMVRELSAERATV